MYRTPKSGPGGESSEEPRSPVATTGPTTPTPTPSTPRKQGLPRNLRLLRAGILTGALVVAVGAPVLVASLASDGSDGLFGKSEVQVLTEDGVGDLVAALEEETGSTEVFSATIYPTYAVVRVPADRTSQREVGYYWDGHDFEPWGSKGTSSNARIDLAEIDAAILPPLVRQARAQVDDPNTWYVIINRDSSDDGWISAYASNEFSEGGYIEVDRNGKEIRRVGWPTEP